MASLLDLKNFIAEKKSVNLSLLLQTFQTSKEDILAILDHLIRKGCVKKCLKTPACATQCFKCQPENFALYQWIEPIV
ncbi:MAG: FeoC-like transcriptional regulator [Rickettsiella sp.]|nr:FeoC-like transcriptional regulator [Rickettsiella sp.]